MDALLQRLKELDLDKSEAFSLLRTSLCRDALLTTARPHLLHTSAGVSDARCGVSRVLSLGA
jgi:hypothetical protein